MQTRYLNMRGTGNRILVVDNRNLSAAIPAEESLKTLVSATGTGFDQIMWIEPARDTGALASYRVFNADGSEVEQCGNGLRCVASWLSAEGPKAFTLESPAGPVEARVDATGGVSVSMGQPVFDPDKVPFDADAPADRYVIDVGSDSVEASVLSMGNPHCVLIVDDIDSAPVQRLGALIETHRRFPQKTNVGFMQILGRGNIALRVFERGVGETAACGSGACAAVVSGVRHDRLDRDVAVRVPGGELVVSWRPDAVWLSGHVELISEGSIDL